MISYITDNPYIRKEIGNAVLLYQIYDWRVIYDKDGSDIDYDKFNINKKFKKREYKDIFRKNEIISIIAESNYKLMHELTFSNSKIYSWDSYDKRVLINFDKSKIKREFEKYIQRSFFSRTIYDKLAAFNMQRIEQMLVYIAIISYRHRTEDIGSNRETDRLINAISYKRPDFWYIIEKLIYHSRKLDITDPFVGDFKFLKEKSSLKKIWEKNKDSELTEVAKVVIFVLNRLEGIMPYVDILKTMRYMEKNELIKVESAKVFQLIESEEFNEAEKFLDKTRWDSLYETYDFSFSMFPALNFIKEIYFECPECGSTELKSSPLNFYCSNEMCKFRVYRVISPVGVSKTIAEKDLFRMLKFGDTIIKNKFGGYNRFFLVKSKFEGKYDIKPYIYSNDINPDKS